MATRYISFAEGEFYHVYNRGVDKRVIYNDDADYRRFQELLFVANSTESVSLRNLRRRHRLVYNHKKTEELVAIGAYCLMPNHFHILLTPLKEGGVSTFLNKLTTGYSMYFNKKHDRSGALFSGSFRAKHADSDEYLKYLFAYIHLNPQKLFSQDSDTLKSVTEFPYSSLIDYVGCERGEGKILAPSYFPEYFKEAKDHLSELATWLQFDQG